MLYEVKDVSQRPGEPFRRWFRDAAFELIVWHDERKAVIGFELCYRDGAEQKALTWRKGKGFTHRGVEAGEDRPMRAKMSPILVPDGDFRKERVLDVFARECRQIDQKVAMAVLGAISSYGLEEPGSK